MNLITQNPDGTVDLTAPVMIPGIPDCDFDRGEPPLTTTQIEYFAKSYEDYSYLDSEHELERNGRKRGKPINSFLLTEDTSFILYDGSQKSYPEGTWMLTSHLTDPEAIHTALNGGYSGYSPTVKNRKVADMYKSAIKSREMTYNEVISACKSHSVDGLIKDVKDPVVLSVSLTGRPCQTHSKFCKHQINGDNMTENENTTKTKVLKALGMTGEAEVSALKSQVDDLDAKIDGLVTKEELNASLKSMQDSFIENMKETLKEVGSSKSSTEDPDEEGEGEEGSEPTKSSEPPKDDNNTDDGGDEEEPPKANQNGASKSRPLHNNNDDTNNPQDVDTYRAMGRNPDGTAKKI